MKSRIERKREKITPRFKVLSFTSAKTMASTSHSLPVDISILEDQVIEVTEMEDAMEECMMFVKKLSETSLTEMEKEKIKLHELLQKAEKEMKNMKQALKRSCSKRDEWRDKCLLERDGKTHVDRQLKEAKQRVQKMESAIEEHKNAVKNLQGQKTRSAETLKDLKEKITTQKTAKKQLEDQLCDVKTTLEKTKSENDELQKRLFAETQKSMHRASAGDDQLAGLNTQLEREKTKFESLEKECAERIRHLEEKLAEQQVINTRLSDEAEGNISELEGKLGTSEATVTQLERCNEELRAKLSNAEKDSEQVEGRLLKVRSENELVVNEKDKRIHELVEELKEAKERLKHGEDDGGEEEESPSDDAKKSLDSKQERRESKSWANIVDEESLHELQLKHDKLFEEHATIQRQFAHLKKHRNQILRENNELHYHVQMATLQLASGNTRFRQQMDQFRVRLQVAESMYEDKVLECNMLDSQLKQLYTGEMYPGEVMYAGPSGYV